MDIVMKVASKYCSDSENKPQTCLKYRAVSLLFKNYVHLLNYFALKSEATVYIVLIKKNPTDFAYSTHTDLCAQGDPAVISLAVGSMQVRLTCRRLTV